MKNCESIDPVLVIKVGTSTLTEQVLPGGERLEAASFQKLGRQVLELQNEGYNPVIVSSAAITAGLELTGETGRPDKDSDMPGLQRLASLGWRHVLNQWDRALPGRLIGEVLLTRRELALEGERSEALRVLHRLLAHGDIPIVNENDVIAHEEIAFGDNDTLAATLAAQITRSKLFGKQVQLVELTDVDGVYQDLNNPASRLAVIKDLDKFEVLAGGPGSANGTGGMLTKYEAARIAHNNGVDMYIAHGRYDNVIARTLAGDTGTFIPAAQQL